jgi:hypothetical protein
MLDQLHKQVPESKSSPEKIQTFSKMLGSYIGEVYRKNYGGEWELVEMNGSTVPGIQNPKEETTFWPWIRVRNRINNGSEDNVWHYQT